MATLLEASFALRDRWHHTAVTLIIPNCLHNVRVFVSCILPCLVHVMFLPSAPSASKQHYGYGRALSECLQGGVSRPPEEVGGQLSASGQEQRLLAVLILNLTETSRSFPKQEQGLPGCTMKEMGLFFLLTHFIPPIKVSPETE